MKSLNLAKPLVLMMVGLPGAGKSFFAKRFSETFGSPLVSLDRLRFELFSNSTFSSEEQKLLTNVSRYQIEELLKSKITFIIDGGCNTKVQRHKLTQLAKKAGYDTLVVWVQTHEPTARTRALKRNKRREDDKYNVSLTPEQFTSFARQLTSPALENSVVISGMHTYSAQAKTVLRKIVASRETAASSAYQTKTEVVKQQTKREPQVRRNVIVR